MYFDSTYLILLPAILFALWAQSRVKSTYAKYSKAFAGLTGEEAARMVLEMNGVNDVTIEPIAGELTDHFDPKTNTIRLSKGVYNVTSVAAVGIAAHEAGHAVQYAVGYSPIKLRTAIIPVTNIGSTLSWPLLLIGVLLGNQTLAMAGVLLFCAVVVFQLVTLPVEFNASNRALDTLGASGYLQPEQLDGAGKVLRAAAMTYVAALAQALAQLLRLLMIANRSRRD
ncbi:MAG: zinc metallopeptidase [Clostridia bacterium]|nr:zinc metallopeptidase [Clostridia bacterium]MBR6574287.1 zinc metallopeptidase [Clostridia bacterium]